MKPERWKEIVFLVKERFEVIEERGFDFENMPGHVETITFLSPLGKMKLEFTRKPVVLDKRTIGSKRIGSQAKVEYTYSDVEETFRLNTYRWNDDQSQWDEMKAENFME